MADMERLEYEIPIILCKLEKIFPPGFFDSMEHLPVHLPYEAKIVGPVQYRWMYPFERFLRQLKLTVKNKVRVEGSICNAYLVKEASNFCTNYFEPAILTKSRNVPRNDDGGDQNNIQSKISIFTYPGRAYGKPTRRMLDDEEYHAAQTYVLLNCEEVELYVRIFTEELSEISPFLNHDQVQLELDNYFRRWFSRYAQHNRDKMDDDLFQLSQGPLRTVKGYGAYFINGYKFHTQSHGTNKSTMNSGVCINGSNFNESFTDYYGRVLEIFELEYPALPMKTTFLFKCDWFDPTPDVGTKVIQQYNLVDVNRKKSFHKYEPFIFAMQAIQDYYVNYPSLKRDKVDWLAVCKVKPRLVVDVPRHIKDAAFQEEEMGQHQIDHSMEINSTQILSDPTGELIEMHDEEEEDDKYDEEELDTSSYDKETEEGESNEDIDSD